MGIKETLGFGSSRKIRYAVVGVGDIAQGAMLPGIAHTGNSELTALVTGDPTKARDVAKHYGVDSTYGYEQFGELLSSGTIDAIYLATPNWRHAEFAIPALESGIHVLTEKPLEISASRCREIMETQKASGAKLMVAYRLHFEPGTLSLIRRIRAGELGDVLSFSSVFTQKVDPDNHRARNGDYAGPLFDMGPYPVNAARYVFDAEPTRVVSAVGTRHAGSGLGDFDDTVAATLLFPGGRIAQFLVSYYSNPVDSFHAIGTAGSIQMSPGFSYHESTAQTRIVGDRQTHEVSKHTDQFGGEMKYFSDCILNDRDPEPDAEEGYADVRVLEGIIEALRGGGPVDLTPDVRHKRIDPDAQLQTLAFRKAPEKVNAASPSGR